MGHLSKWEFGTETLPKRCILLAGMTPPHLLERIQGTFQAISFSKHDNYHPVLATIEGSEVLVLFQVYGAAMVADLITLLADGQTEEILFIGAAYGLGEDQTVGDYVIPMRVQCLDGVTTSLGFPAYAEPDPDLVVHLERLFHGRGNLRSGTTISVPATFWHPSSERYDPEAIALEMEFASLCTFAREKGLRAAGILVVSDTKSKSLQDDQSSRYESTYQAFKKIAQRPWSVSLLRSDGSLAG